jgi:hypothetical protein
MYRALTEPLIQSAQPSEADTATSCPLGENVFVCYDRQANQRDATITLRPRPRSLVTKATCDPRYRAVDG